MAEFSIISPYALLGIVCFMHDNTAILKAATKLQI